MTKTNIIILTLIGFLMLSCSDEQKSTLLNLAINEVINNEGENQENQNEENEENPTSEGSITDELKVLEKEILNTQHLENAEDLALKISEYENMANDVNILIEKYNNGDIGALDIVQGIRLAKNLQRKLTELKENNQLTPEQSQKIDSLVGKLKKEINIDVTKE